MAIHYRTQGIILKKVDRGEADQLFTIYTKDFGKLEILGRAIRKISSKLKSGAEIFYLSEVEFIQGKTYKTLTDAILIDKFENIKKDLKKFKIAHRIASVFDDLIQGQETDEKIWQLSIEVFQKLNNPDLKAEISNLIYYYFLWNLLAILGYEPHLYNCTLCQNKLKTEKLYFNLREGGVICNFCQKSVKLTKSGSEEKSLLPTKEISPETIKILRLLLKKDWPILNRLKIESKNLNSLKLFSDYFLPGLFPSQKNLKNKD